MGFSAHVIRQVIETMKKRDRNGETLHQQDFKSSSESVYCEYP